MDIFRIRDGTVIGSSMDSDDTMQISVKRMTSLLAPSGRPTYISEAAWQWIRLRASIQTLVHGQGGMDMLFDQISRDAT
jgi:hypothetical protein